MHIESVMHLLHFFSLHLVHFSNVVDVLHLIHFSFEHFLHPPTF